MGQIREYFAYEISHCMVHLWDTLPYIRDFTEEFSLLHQTQFLTILVSLFQVTVPFRCFLDLH